LPSETPKKASATLDESVPPRESIVCKHGLLAKSAFVQNATVCNKHPHMLVGYENIVSTASFCPKFPIGSRMSSALEAVVKVKMPPMPRTARALGSSVE